MERNIPFALLFEESGSNNYWEKPEYDADMDLSVVWMGNKKVPFVTLGQGLGTQTLTRMEIEATDRDAQLNDTGAASSYGLGTGTFTDVKVEVTDSDPGGGFLLGTLTFTAVKIESTDEDR